MSVKKEKTYYFDITQVNTENFFNTPVGTYFIQCDHIPTTLEICNYLIKHKNDIFERPNDIKLADFTFFNANTFKCIEISSNRYAMVSNIRTIC